MTAHTALPLTLLLLALLITSGLAAAYYIKVYVDNKQELEIEKLKYELHLQERRQYFLDHPLIPSEELCRVQEGPKEEW